MLKHTTLLSAGRIADLVSGKMRTAKKQEDMTLAVSAWLSPQPEREGKRTRERERARAREREG